MATATLEKTAPKKAASPKRAAVKAPTTRARKAAKPKPVTKAPATKAAAPAKPKAAKPKPKAKNMHNKELGARGEEAAARFLVHRGYEILERNWTCTAGEADIVARDGDAIVFVEVKTRSDSSMGFPAEAVTAKKRQRYERIACLYLERHELTDVLVRFDVISLVAIATDRALIRHHINAWAEAGR